MYVHPFVILIDLNKINNTQDTKFLLDLFGSYINSLEFSILNLSLSTKLSRNGSKYLIHYKSSSPICEDITTPLISIYKKGHNMYKKLTSNKKYHTIARDGILMISPLHTRYLIDQINAYSSNHTTRTNAV